MQLVTDRSVAPVVLGPSLNPHDEVTDLIRLGFEIETGKPVTIAKRDRIYLLQIGRSAPVSVVVREEGKDFLSIDFGSDLRSARGAVVVKDEGTIIFRENYPTHFIMTSFGFFVADWSGSNMANRQLRSRISTFDRCAELFGLNPQHVVENSEVLSSPTIW